MCFINEKKGLIIKSFIIVVMIFFIFNVKAAALFGPVPIDVETNSFSVVWTTATTYLGI